MLLLGSTVIWCFVLSFQNFYCQSQEDFCYRAEQCPLTPDRWGEVYPNCNGQAQSPVYITYNSADVPNFEMRELHFSQSYAEPRNYIAENTGRRLLVRPTTQDLSLTGDLVDGSTFYFDSVEFHWGHSTTQGYGWEHSINGHKQSMEAQLKHQDAYGKTIIFSAIFFINSNDNAGLTPITNALDNVKLSQTQTEVTGLVLADFFPKTSSAPVIRYTGSLTSPACTEGIDWFIFPGYQKISQSQVEKFQAVRDSAGVQLGGNIRALQNLNGRTLEPYRVSVTTESARVLSETQRVNSKKVD